MSNARAKTINLILEDGNLKGLISIEDSGWGRGILYSSPRDKVGDLLVSNACEGYGVYLLLSDDMVYVGQSINLAQRIKQHVLGKDWWERVIVLTTVDNSFTKTDIDYLESVLIDKANKNNRLDCDNKTKGNPPKVNRHQQIMLDQYLDEALFLMELIGISVFSESIAGVKKSKRGLISSIESKNQEEIEIRKKSEAKKFLNENGIEICSEFTYASRQEKRMEFWANPNINLLNKDWNIVLNNQYEMEIVVIDIPANSISLANENDKKGLYVRKDKPYRIDLNIAVDTLVDKKSKIDFSKYVIERLRY